MLTNLTRSHMVTVGGRVGGVGHICVVEHNSGPISQQQQKFRITNENEVGILDQAPVFPPSLQCCTFRVWSILGESVQVDLIKF